jgi:hypothetical protein
MNITIEHKPTELTAHQTPIEYTYPIFYTHLPLPLPLHHLSTPLILPISP